MTNPTRRPGIPLIRPSTLLRRLFPIAVTGAFAASGLVAAATPAFAVGAPAVLIFSTQPAGAAAGTALTTQPLVTIEDAQGNVETS